MQLLELNECQTICEGCQASENEPHGSFFFFVLLNQVFLWLAGKDIFLLASISARYVRDPPPPGLAESCSIRYCSIR